MEDIHTQAEKAAKHIEKAQPYEKKGMMSGKYMAPLAMIDEQDLFDYPDLLKNPDTWAMFCKRFPNKVVKHKPGTSDLIDKNPELKRTNLKR